MVEETFALAHLTHENRSLNFCYTIRVIAFIDTIDNVQVPLFKSRLNYLIILDVYFILHHVVFQSKSVIQI